MEREIEPGADTEPEAAIEQPNAGLEPPEAAPEQLVAELEQPEARKAGRKPPARAAAAPERGEESGAAPDRDGGRPAPRAVAAAWPRPRRACVMCVEKMTSIDYKDFSFLRRFLSDRGRIESRRKSGTCAKHQRALAQAIKRARHLALLPYTAEHVRTGVGSSR
jgi:small subunit ribosomal protein S18